jgi:ketosteroid isomerase-like protein
MRHTLLLLAVLLLSASSSLGQSKESKGGGAVRAAIEVANKQFVAAFNKGDAAGVAAMYSGDARVMPPNGPMGEGGQAVQQFWQGAISAGAKIVSLETLHVESRGDLAFEVGRYKLTVPAPGGATATDTGKYVVVWEREGGKWKLATDIWNSDAPAQTK